MSIPGVWLRSISFSVSEIKLN